MIGDFHSHPKIAKMLSKTTKLTAEVASPLGAPSTLGVDTYFKWANLYKGSEQSKAMATRFCMEFESNILALGFAFQPDPRTIAKAQWVGNNVHVVQDVIALFQKAGISLDAQPANADACVYLAGCNVKIPRFGGPTQIRIAAYSNGMTTLTAEFSFFGL